MLAVVLLLRRVRVLIVGPAKIMLVDVVLIVNESLMIFLVEPLITILVAPVVLRRACTKISNVVDTAAAIIAAAVQVGGRSALTEQVG